MKPLLSNIKKLFAFVLVSSLLTSPLTTIAQEKFHAQTIDISIKGTSTLHDWEMTSSDGKFEALVAMDKDKVTFSGLHFTLPAKTLKSGHGIMDKNTYKALNTDKNPNISFVLSSATVTPLAGNSYQFKGVGSLTIAGTTKQTEITAQCKYNPAENSFTVIGTKKFKMTEFNVKPPTVMMGTIKTGDDIAITYNLKIKG